MAPLPPFGKADLLRWLRGTATTPLRFGSPHPYATVVVQDGMWRMRELKADMVTLVAASEEALRAGRSFMPEHASDLMEPVGPIHLEAPSRDALAQLVEAFTWPASWR